jgi:murein DD-endopeptidase MepM/ murein hydrolase activator NlpD
MSSFRAGSIALVVAAALAVAAPARAQEPADPSSTTTSSSTSSTTSTSTPGPTIPGALPTDTSTTSTSVPPEDPAANGDAPPETVPPVSITVPPRPPEAYGSQPSLASYPGRVVRVSSRTARARATESQAVVDAAVARRDLLAIRRLQLREATARLAVDERAAISAVEEAQIAFEQRAADAYIRGNLGGTRELILSEDATQYVARLELLEVVVEADERAVRTFREAREAVDEEQLRTATELANVARELLAAEDAVVSAQLEHELASRELAVFLNGGSLVIHGFAFPVGAPHQFGDSFGAPRMTGTPYEHWHEGTDIFAPMGTPLPACERGVVMRIGSGGVLGGNTVWLRGESGVAYYYAHLSDFAPGLQEGMVVDPGTVLGFVGDTGNARGTSPHLHFEVHPGGGAAVNPYPILAVADQQVQPELIWLE